VIVKRRHGFPWGEDGRVSDRLVVVASGVVVLLAGVVGAAPMIPPGAPADPDATAFSTASAFKHIERIARAPHPIGTIENERVRSFILGQLRALDLEPELQTVEAPDYFGGSNRSVSVENVLARIPGSASTRAVAVVGHYDTAPTSPGANDDASAVAVMLETARAILAGPQLRNDVVLLFTDGEEPAPRFGSSAFVSEHPWAAEVGFVINLEALGSSGPSTLIENSGPDAWILDEYADALRYPVAFSYLTTTAALIGGSGTDFGPFRDAGIPGVELAYLHGSPIYHTLADAPERVSLRSLHHHGTNTLGLVRHFGGLELRNSHTAGDAVFFTFGRFTLVRYPASWALPIAVLAGALLAVAMGRRRVAGRPRSAIPLRGIAALLLVVLLSALAVTAVWTVLATQRATMGVGESYLYLAGLVGITVGIGAAVSRLVERRTSSRADAAGVVGVWWLLALLTSATAPGFSYLFVWPALGGALALLWTSSPSTIHARPWRELAIFALVAGTALILLVPAVDSFYQLAQPRPGNSDSEILPLVSIPVALIALVVELIRGFSVRTKLSGEAEEAHGTVQV
jgi:hypothetical protein